ncbi:Replication termination factor 2 [Taxawa tesnikishii (nom. ined.)]|nr:Replication termination factor 2 [Dothideales sp. JES 119]
MGNDGGSIPTRRELVKEAARNPTVTQQKEKQAEQQSYYWTTDPISRKPLAAPVVSDCNGKLYNKDTILEYLLPSEAGEASKTEAEAILQGSVKSLKDIIEVKFESDTSGDCKNDQQKWKCPVTGDRLGPGSKAVYLVPCGHAFSGSAIKEVSGERCLVCNETYASNDIIPIIPVAETDVARLALRMKRLKENNLTHSLKKASKESSKKRKKHAIDTADGTSTTATLYTEKTDSKQPTSSRGTPTPRTSTPVNGINNAATASLTAKVLAEQTTKKRKVDNDNVRSLFSSRDQSKPQGKSSDFMTRGFEIPADARHK